MATIKMDSNGYAVEDKGTVTNSCSVNLTPGVWTKISWRLSSGDYTTSFDGEAIVTFSYGVNTHTKILTSLTNAYSSNSSYEIVALRLS